MPITYPSSLGPSSKFCLAVNKTHSYCKGHRCFIIWQWNLNVAIPEALFRELPHGNFSPQSSEMFKSVEKLKHSIRL